MSKTTRTIAGLVDGRAVELVSKSRQFVSGLAPLSPAGTTAMNTISRSAEALSRAFNMGMP